MTHVVSIRLRDYQLDRLKPFARRMGKSQSEMGAQFIEESMRDAELPTSSSAIRSLAGSPT